MPPEVVVGAGHNGLVAACYLAMAGRDVLVLEALDRPGGGAWTAETVPGYRFDLHSVAHNILNMTDIPAELDLAGAGLAYQEMDPFSIAVMEDGRRVRFFRSVAATVDSIAETDPAEAEAYRRFIDVAMPLIKVMLPAIRGEMPVRALPGRAANLLRTLRRQPATVVRDLLSPYDSLLRRRLLSDLTRGPVAAFAAHAGVGPNEPGSSLFAFWQAAYHLFGQWHAPGGARGLTDALVRRLTALGGQLRCDAPVARIDARGGRVHAVVLDSGERIEAANVVTATDPQLALLELLDPPLGGQVGADLAAARRSNVVQAVVHVATDRLPEYRDGQPGDWNGLQSFVDRLDDLSGAWRTAEAGDLPTPPPLYAFTTSAIDPSLAPPGHHTVYLASPAAPATVRGGWDACRDAFVDASIDVIARRAPGFRDSIQGVYAWTPDRMAQGGHPPPWSGRLVRPAGPERAIWPGAHPMHLDITLDQLGPLRPTRALGRHRTPIEGLYLSGAGTNPTGGIAGTPGRMAAKALLAENRHGKRPPAHA